MRLIDADKITYSWQIDLDGQEHDGVTLQSIINKMPSIDAVPHEPLTDNEQRIFLSAMSREVEVCQKIDDETWREPYEDSLVFICNEIKRKVKGALWT